MPYQYINSQAAAAAIGLLPTLAPRTHGNCLALLIRLGQRCVDDRHNIDGLVSEADAKCAMPMGWRTVKKHIEVLVQSGALEPVTGGWQIADFAVSNNRNRAKRAQSVRNVCRDKSPETPSETPYNAESKPLTLASCLQKPNVRGSNEPEDKGTPPANSAPVSDDDSFEARCERMRQHQASQQQDPMPCPDDAVAAPPAPLQQHSGNCSSNQIKYPRPPRHPNAAKHASKKAAAINLGEAPTEQVACELLLGAGCPADDVYDLVPDTFSALVKQGVREGEVGYALRTMSKLEFEPKCRAAYLLSILNKQREKRAEPQQVPFSPFVLPRHVFARAAQGKNAPCHISLGPLGGCV